MVSMAQTQPQSDQTTLSGKSIIITGGTTGIGRATARLLAAEGAKVLIFGRHQKELAEALDEAGQAGTVHGLVADQSRHEERATTTGLTRSTPTCSPTSPSAAMRSIACVRAGRATSSTSAP